MKSELRKSQLFENGNIHHHLLQFKKCFLDLAKFNDPVIESKKTRIRLCSLLKSLSLFAVTVQANNMNYVDLFVLLNPEDKRQTFARQVTDKVPPIQRAARMDKSNQNIDQFSKDRANVRC